MSQDMLPGNSTPFERAMSLSTDVLPVLLPATGPMRGIKIANPPNSYLPFLHWEYGLGPISAYFTDGRQLISEGLQWSRLRGTHGAIARALGWIGQTGDVEPFPVRRRRWNLFMLAMGAMPAAEEPALLDIDYLAGLSAPLRSKFWRGFRTYDVRAVDFGYSSWSNARWSSYSGARIRETGAKWSFGRNYTLVHTMAQADLEALGVWIEPSGTGLSWGNFSWQDSTASWGSAATAVRVVLMANGTLNRPVWFCFRDANGAVIGYRRARAVRGVGVYAGGPYEINGTTYAPVADSPLSIYLEGMTDFGDGYGATAATWSLLFDATPLDAAKPGLLWAGPGELSAGTEILTTAQTIEFRRTVRERFRVLLNF